MNILFINKFLYPKGGTETYMMGLGAELSHRGHRVEYFGMEHRGNCVGNRVGAYTKDTDYHTANPVKKVSYALRTIYSTPRPAAAAPGVGGSAAPSGTPEQL